METLDLPLIDEAALAPRETASEVVDAPSPAVSKEVALATIRTTALSELSAVAHGIAALRADHGATDYDITTPKGMALAEARRYAVRQVRYKVPHVVKARKAELKDISDALVAEGDRIIAELKAIEDPHDKLIEAETQRRADEKAEAERVAKLRSDAYLGRIDGIRGCVAQAQATGMTSERIAAGIAKVELIPMDAAHWAEFEAQAVKARAETLATMRTLLASAKAREDAEAEAERKRLEQQRIDDELAERRKELDAKSAKLAEDVAAFERLQAALRQEQIDKAEATRVAADLLKTEAPANAEPDPEPVIQTPTAAADIDLDPAVGAWLGALTEDDMAAEGAPAALPSAPSPAVEADTRPPITTGALCTLLTGNLPGAITLSVETIRALGFEPAPKPLGTKAGTYWQAADEPRIKAALARHFGALSHAAAASTWRNADGSLTYKHWRDYAPVAES